MCTIQNCSVMDNTLSWKDKITSSLNTNNKITRAPRKAKANVHTKPSKPKPQKSNVQMERSYHLNNEWTLYYHNPTSNDWTMNSYMCVGTFRTIGDFSAYYKALDFEHNHQGMFFLMRGNIKPTWEDPKNIKGGCWSFKISLEHFFTVWKELSMLMVGESLSTQPLLINGISMSPKRGFCIIKLWNHDSSQSSMSLLRLSQVNHLEDNGPALYTPFDKKK